MKRSFSLELRFGLCEWGGSWEDIYMIIHIEIEE